MDPRRVVIVGRKDEYIEPLRSTLIARGWLVRACPGPAQRSCPLLSAQDCSVRDWAEAAIVFLDPRTGPTANLVKARCAAGSPAVVLLEGQVDPPRREREYIVMGALRSSVGIAESLSQVAISSDVPDRTH